MASGSAVIAADAGGFRESIQPGTTGLLVPAHEPRAYRDAIVALANDAAARFALAAAARDYALSRDVAREKRRAARPLRGPHGCRPTTEEHDVPRLVIVLPDG